MNRRWNNWTFAAAGLTIALGAFTLLVPRKDDERVVREWLSEIPEVAAEEELFNARRDSVRNLNDALERLTALEVARATHSAQVARGNSSRSSFGAAANVPRLAREQFGERVASEFAEMGDAHAMPVRVQLVADSSVRFWYSRIVVLPREPGDPCSVIITVTDRANTAIGPRPRDRVVAACGLYGRFGMPGKAMNEWLLATSAWAATTDVAQPRPDSIRQRPWYPVFVAREAAVGACAAGDRDACTSLLVSRQRDFFLARFTGRDTLFRAATTGVIWMHPFVTLETPGTYLAMLRAELGDERFGEFWRSDAGPAEAYLALTGESLGEFVYDHLMQHVPPHRPGPLHAGLPLALGLAVGVTAAVLAVRLTRREQT